MSDMKVGDWANVVMAICAVFAFVFSVWSYRRSSKAEENAKRSADAAQNSAKEATNTRRIQQAELLAPHFDKIFSVLNSIKFGKKIDVDDVELLAAVSSVGSLQGLLHNDSEIQDCLSYLLELFSKEHPYSSSALYVASAGYTPERLHAEHGKTMSIFDAKRRELLNIG